MLTREERFYAMAAEDLSQNKLSQSVWGKAFSLAVGDEPKAKALYISLRVNQLESDYQQSILDLLRSSKSEILAGKRFLCPYCESQTAAEVENVDFFVHMIEGIPSKRYRCKSCRRALQTDFDGDSVGSVTQEPRKSNNGFGVTGFCLGMASTLLFHFGILPVFAVVASLIGLVTYDPVTQKNRWMAVVGLLFGLIYTVMMLNLYGHIK